jgi:PAS domain S-box-containing protein
MTTLHLLVVEDNPGDYLLLQEYLKISGLLVENIFHAVSLAEVQPIVADKEIDVVLLDLTLPDSNGIQSFNLLNKLLPHTPIIILSGFSDKAVALETISLGAQDYLLKGEFDEKDLAKSVQYSIERKKTLETLRENNERYELVNRATNDIIWEWDLVTNETIRGIGLSKIFGYAKEDIGSNFDWWIDKIQPSEKERVQNNIQHCISNKIEKWQDEYGFFAADGLYKFVLDRGYLMFDSNGKPYRMIGAMTDITERKKAELKLTESENHLRTIIQSEPECIKLMNQNNELLEINPAGLAMIEADNMEQVQGKNILGIIKPQYKKGFKKLTRDVFNGKSGKLEFEITGLKGTNCWLDTHAVPMKNAKGEIISLLGITRDITESKKAEETIRNLYQAVEQTDEIVFITDIDGTITFMNAAFEEVYGYKREEVVGKTTPHILKSGVMSKQFYDQLWKKLLAGRSIRNEIINKTKDGRLITIDTSLSPIYNDQKALIGFMAVQEDITEKKMAEKKLLNAELQYRTLFEQSPDGISIIDVETLLPLEFNEKIHTQLGYSREEFSQLKISDYEIIDTYEEIEEIEVRAKKVMEGQGNFETRHKTKNGDIRDVQVTILKITFHDKPVLYTIFRDITEKRKLEKELKQQEINLQRQITEATIQTQEEERNELGRELHDNINQILATVKMYLGMAKAKENFNIDLLGQSYEYVNEAMEEIRKLSHSLVAPSLGDIGLPEVLEELVQITNVPNGLQVQLVNEIDNGQMIDDKKELMLYRIVQEQMNNIHKHAQAKIVIIHLKKAGNNLHLSIADDGVGFNSTQKVSGIGIKNIQSRVEFYSGKVNIISAPGKGCILEISIPF